MKTSTLKNLLLFLKDNERIEEELNFKDKVTLLIKLYGYLILFSLVYNIILSVVINVFNLFSDNVASSNSTSLNLGLYIVIILLIAPIHEELMFRLFLIKFEAKKFLISSSLLLSYITYWAIKEILPVIEIFNNQIVYYGYLLIFYIIFHFILYLIIKQKQIAFLKYIWNKNFVVFFYLTSILFTLLHLKHNLSDFSLIVQYLRLIPIFLFSLCLGYLRINLGFMYALVFHILFNIPSIITIIWVSLR